MIRRENLLILEHSGPLRSEKKEQYKTLEKGVRSTYVPEDMNRILDKSRYGIVIA